MTKQLMDRIKADELATYHLGSLKVQAEAVEKYIGLLNWLRDDTPDRIRHDMLWTDPGSKAAHSIGPAYTVAVMLKWGRGNVPANLTTYMESEVGERLRKLLPGVVREIMSELDDGVRAIVEHRRATS